MLQALPQLDATAATTAVAASATATYTLHQLTYACNSPLLWPVAVLAAAPVAVPYEVELLAGKHCRNN
jgi:hypothetical protein